MSGLEYTLRSDDVSPFLTGIIKSMGLGPVELKAPLEKWGKYYLAQIPPMFRRSGRGGIRWASLSPSTRANYRARGIQGSLPLFRTGAMMRSIKAEGGVGFGNYEMKISSDDPNIGFHQGGSHLPARTIHAKGKALRFRVGGKWVYARKVNIPAAEIPARPVLFITEQDNEKAIELVRAQITKLINAGYKYVPGRAAA
jgi:phage gpG-like protein